MEKSPLSQSGAPRVGGRGRLDRPAPLVTLDVRDAADGGRSHRRPTRRRPWRGSGRSARIGLQSRPDGHSEGRRAWLASMASSDRLRDREPQRGAHRTASRRPGTGRDARTAHRRPALERRCPTVPGPAPRTACRSRSRTGRRSRRRAACSPGSRRPPARRRASRATGRPAASQLPPRRRRRPAAPRGTTRNAQGGCRAAPDAPPVDAEPTAITTSAAIVPISLLLNMTIPSWRLTVAR